MRDHQWHRQELEIRHHHHHHQKKHQISLNFNQKNELYSFLSFLFILGTEQVIWRSSEEKKVELELENHLSGLEMHQKSSNVVANRPSVLRPMKLKSIAAHRALKRI